MMEDGNSTLSSPLSFGTLSLSISTTEAISSGPDLTGVLPAWLDERRNGRQDLHSDGSWEGYVNAIPAVFEGVELQLLHGIRTSSSIRHS